MTKKYFFGWTNMKWFVREIVAIYSGGQSYFSKKRIESGFAFLALEVGMLTYFFEKYQLMSVTDLIIWATPQALIAGYAINKIEQEKKNHVEEVKEEVKE